MTPAKMEESHQVDSVASCEEEEKKLSLRMNLTTPVNEESDESLPFSLESKRCQEGKKRTLLVPPPPPAWIAGPCLDSPRRFQCLCEARRCWCAEVTLLPRKGGMCALRPFGAWWCLGPEVKCPKRRFSSLPLLPRRACRQSKEEWVCRWGCCQVTNAGCYVGSRKSLVRAIRISAGDQRGVSVFSTSAT